ncbi:MAG TPA: hypothetical protein DCG78_00315, partial [Anaerolineaceae bacterium]|nr:hypothetical protein [Anaerolineaceae bacterium]
GRFRVEWISAAEGDKYARVLNEMQATLDAMPEEELLAEIERLRPEMERRLGRLGTIPGVGPALDYTQGIIEAMQAKEAVAR